MSERRNNYPATRFPGKALKRLRDVQRLEHRQVRYLNNRIEGDHARIRRVIRPGQGFSSMKTACAAIKGNELMRMFKKGQFARWIHDGIGGRPNEFVFINQLFGIYA